MHRSLTVFLATVLVLIGPRNLASAQCSGCSADTGCIVDPPFPTLCPLAPPDATEGEYYASDITFWMPPTFMDPGSGFTVSFLQMTITGVSGLPFGLSLTADEPSGVYYPQSTSYGCARICGTPLGAGTFPITINIIASVEVSGISIDVPQQFAILLHVQQGSGSNNSFSFSPASGCGSVTASFQSLIDAAPQPTTWAWDFGNGNTSDLATPPLQTYSGPGTYSISLETTIGGYVLQSVSLTGVNGNWCGDVEEPNIPLVGCTGSPDPYFILTDASGGTVESSTVDNSTTAVWNDLGLVLDNAPYSISFHDEDVISQDDLLGTYNIPANGTGTYFMNIANGTTGSLTIGLEPLQVFTDTDTLVVHPLPESTLLENATNGELCASIDTLAGYVWLLNGEPVPGVSTPCYVPDSSGIWQVEGTNGFGCSSISNSVVICPEVSIVREGNVLSVPGGFINYAWTFNGTAVGGDQPYLITQEDGVYSVTMEGANDCVFTAEYVLNTVGIDTPRASVGRLRIYPNPSNGLFTLEVDEGMDGLVRIRIYDIRGQVVHEERHRVVNGGLKCLVAHTLGAGAYQVELMSGRRSLIGRLIVD